jgi:DNA invertase Pin-like site-specific DNA recombinase
MKAAIYARVSTLDQEPENQLMELRRYLGARGWTAVEYVDRGVSGAKDAAGAESDAGRRATPTARRYCLLAAGPVRSKPKAPDYAAGRVADAGRRGFVPLNEGIDATTAAGRLQMAVLAAIAVFERDP